MINKILEARWFIDSASHQSIFIIHFSENRWEKCSAIELPTMMGKPELLALPLAQAQNIEKKN